MPNKLAFAWGRFSADSPTPQTGIAGTHTLIQNKNQARVLLGEPVLEVHVKLQSKPKLKVADLKDCSIA